MRAGSAPPSIHLLLPATTADTLLKRFGCTFASAVNYVGYAIYVLCVLVTIGWIVGIRTYTLRGSPPTRQTVNATMLFVVSLALVPLLSLSPFHLLWMFPVSFVFGILSLAFPFSLVSLPGQWFFFLTCIGLDREQALRNQARLARLREVIANEGVTPERARELLIERGEW